MKHCVSILILMLLSVSGILRAEEFALSDSLRHVSTIRLADVDYIPGHTFYDLPEVEEIIFDGRIGHIDGYVIGNCPQLKKIVFNGPVFSTGGEQFAENCPSLTDIEINALALNYYLTKFPGCDNIKPIRVNGAVLSTTDSGPSTTDAEKVATDPEYVDQIIALANWQMWGMHEEGFLKNMATDYYKAIHSLAEQAGLQEVSDSLKATFVAYGDPDLLKTKLQVLKESNPYRCNPEDTTRLFTYAAPNDSMLTVTREYFNLDSIAGDGDDVSRIKNLLYWVHDLVRHDGGSMWPDCHFNLPELARVCAEQQRGLNCRFMAFMLTEALLAEGIPARYITCQPKAWDTDRDCHVICVAWAESLGKWIWVDPTFAAYVTDENGLLLHPGEVRYRLQNDLPLILNEDANWNHKSIQTKEYYLDEYMAKNLYLLSANTIQQSEPEGTSEHEQGYQVALVPVDFNFGHSRVITNDDCLFWQAP